MKLIKFSGVVPNFVEKRGNDHTFPSQKTARQNSKYRKNSSIGTKEIKIGVRGDIRQVNLCLVAWSLGRT